MDTRALPTVVVGEFRGPYRLLERLGEGGMGVVHMAVTPDGTVVAVKSLRPSVVAGEDARARLAREVASLRRVHGPRIAEVLGADVDADPPYVVTRYVRGRSLDRVVADHGPLRPEALRRLAYGLADALAAVHAAGVVHRDVKPGNVMMRDGEPVLIDFGLAVSADQARLTVAGMVLGTPSFLAPESVAGAEPRPATDVHGWAGTLVFAATGRPPYGDGPMAALLDRIRREAPDLAGVPPELAELLRPALDPDPGHRPPAAWLRDRLAWDEPDRHATVVTPAPGTGRMPAPGPRSAPAPTGAAVTAVVPAPAPTGTAVTTAVPVPAPAAVTAVVPAPAPAAVTAVVPAPAPAAVTAVVPAPAPAPAPLPATVPATAAVPADPWEAPEPGEAGEAGAPGDFLTSYRHFGGAATTLSVVGLAALVVAGTLVAPYVTLAVLAVGVLMARTADRARTAMARRRAVRGPRRGDPALATAGLPWHAVMSVFPAVGQAVVAGSAATVAGSAVWAFGGGLRWPLLAAGLTAAAAIWWGPGGLRTRAGTRYLLSPLTPGRAKGWILPVVFLLLAWLLGLWWESYGTAWSPADGPPAEMFGIPL